MASDLSNIIKEELSNTLEQLLSKTSKVEKVDVANFEDFAASQCIESSVTFNFRNLSSSWKFYVPTNSATKFEYLMLGGMGDLKEHIDDEITDAVNEIISNICGSISTSINAQGFSDVSGIKNEIGGSSIVDCSVCEDKTDVYEFVISLDSENFSILICFDDVILPFICEITGKEVEAGSDSMADMQDMGDMNDMVDVPMATATPKPIDNPLGSILSDESTKKLKTFI